MLIGSPERSERFNQAFLHLLRYDVAHEFVGDASPITPPSDADLTYLMSTATRLSLSNSSLTASSAEECRLAYEIAVRAPRASTMSDAMFRFSDLVFTRLGNFPARGLLRSRSKLVPLNDPVFQVEQMIREEENLAGTDSALLLTNFQARLLDGLSSNRHLSVSAPTSAGKSFTLELELLRRLKAGGRFNAIFIVPTRALIRQVSLDLMALMREAGLACAVLSSPQVPDSALLESSQTIFVLTQERLATLLVDAPVNFKIDAVIVDEAHEISKESRGITLERVIQMSLSRSPTLRLFFSSPLRSNPEFLLELFGQNNDSALHFVERESPVTQNLISIRPVHGSPKQVDLELTIETNVSPLGRLDLSFPLRGRYMGNIALLFTKEDETSIVYCNRPSEATKNASQIADQRSLQDDEDLQQFAAFLRQEVHGKYRLANLVLKGVAFHYGNLPQIVRGKIEELAKDRKIRFVCCTSTLLQGMNLPAKNLFVEDPKTGTGDGGIMARGDFWNLAGRAGRLAKEFTGNVFCIFGKPWDAEVLKAEKLTPIESARSVALTYRANELAFYSETLSSGPDRKQAWAEYAMAGIYADQLAGTSLSSPSASEETRAALERVVTVCRSVITEQLLPDELYARNLYVHPRRMEDLARFFLSQDRLADWMPLMPFRDSRSERLTSIFGVIEEVILKEPEAKRNRYFGYLGSRWMKGDSLHSLVADHLAFYKIKDEEEAINSEINSLFEAIERELRYTYVKYTSIYNQVLKAVLISKGEVELSEQILPIHLFLEFGASSRTLISLMSNGMSRTSALLIKPEAGLPDDLDATRCATFIRSIDLSRSRLPAICKTEIRRLRGN